MRRPLSSLRSFSLLPAQASRVQKSGLFSPLSPVRHPLSTLSPPTFFVPSVRLLLRDRFANAIAVVIISLFLSPFSKAFLLSLPSFRERDHKEAPVIPKGEIAHSISPRRREGYDENVRRRKLQCSEKKRETRYIENEDERGSVEKERERPFSPRDCSYHSCWTNSRKKNVEPSRDIARKRSTCDLERERAHPPHFEGSPSPAHDHVVLEGGFHIPRSSRSADWTKRVEFSPTKTRK